MGWINRIFGSGQQSSENEQRHSAPFQRMSVTKEARSTLFDPERWLLRTEIEQSLFAFSCGHIARDAADGGRCDCCGKFVCSSCTSRCIRCGKLTCNLHTVRIDAKTSYCPSCYEQVEESQFFSKALNIAKEIFFFPFKK